MKFFVAFALCLALVSASPQGRRKRSDDSSEEEDDEWDIQPFTVSSFRDAMLEQVQIVLDIEHGVESFEGTAKEVLYDDDVTEEDFDRLGGEWHNMTRGLGETFDKVAIGLVKIAFGLYITTDGSDFIETNDCDNYENFDSVTFDPTDVTGYLNQMGDVFLEDVKCFKETFRSVEEVGAVLNAATGGMSEDEAATMVMEFIKGLHLTRLNAIRFVRAVEGAVEKMHEAETRKKKGMKRLLALANALKKRGLLRK